MAETLLPQQLQPQQHAKVSSAAACDGRPGLGETLLPSVASAARPPRSPSEGASQRCRSAERSDGQARRSRSRDPQPGDRGPAAIEPRSPGLTPTAAGSGDRSGPASRERAGDGLVDFGADGGSRAATAEGPLPDGAEQLDLEDEAYQLDLGATYQEALGEALDELDDEEDCGPVVLGEEVIDDEEDAGEEDEEEEDEERGEDGDEDAEGEDGDEDAEGGEDEDGAEEEGDGGEEDGDADSDGGGEPEAAPSALTDAQAASLDSALPLTALVGATPDAEPEKKKKKKKKKAKKKKGKKKKSAVQSEPVVVKRRVPVPRFAHPRVVRTVTEPELVVTSVPVAEARSKKVRQELEKRLILGQFKRSAQPQPRPEVASRQRARSVDPAASRAAAAEKEPGAAERSRSSRPPRRPEQPEAGGLGLSIVGKQSQRAPARSASQAASSRFAMAELRKEEGYIDPTLASQYFTFSTMKGPDGQKVPLQNRDKVIFTLHDLSSKVAQPICRSAFVIVLMILVIH